MIVSPRSLAKRPVILGAIIFALLGASFYAGMSLLEGHTSARTTALEERATELENEWVDEKMESYTPSKPLCDDTPPSASASEAAWLAHLDCLEARHRDPNERLLAATRGLDRWDSDALRERRWALLNELGRWDTLVAHLRDELQNRELTPERRETGQMRLIEALLKQSSVEWETRAVEAAALGRQVEPESCSDLATLTYAFDAAGEGDEVVSTLEAYASRGCADRVHSGELRVLMEQVGVGSVARGYERAPQVVRDSPRLIANNFTIKSEFAMCAAELPDNPDMRRRCETMLESF